MSDLQGSNMNYAALVFARASAERPALIFQSEIFTEAFEISWEELQAQVTSLADYLKFIGIQKGDVIAGYMPNIPETLMAYLATAAVGGVWLNLDPKSNNAKAISLLQDAKPKLLIAVDGYHWKGEKQDHLKSLSKIADKIPSLKKVVIFPYCMPDCDRSLVEKSIFWNETYNGAAQTIDYANVSIDDKLVQVIQEETSKSFTTDELFGDPTADFALRIDIDEATKVLLYANADSTDWFRAINALLHGATLCMYDGYADTDFIKKVETDIGTTHSIIKYSEPAGDGLWDKVKGWF